VRMKNKLESERLPCGSMLHAKRGSTTSTILSHPGCWEIEEMICGGYVDNRIEIDARSIPPTIAFLQQLYANTPKRYRRKEDR